MCCSSISLWGYSSNVPIFIPIKYQRLPATPLCAFGGTCLVKRLRINAEMWAKLDKIKHTGECTDAGHCSKCAALLMFSNMGFLMRVWWLFLELEPWKSVWPVLRSVDPALHPRCSQSEIKGQPSSSALQLGVISYSSSTNQRRSTQTYLPSQVQSVL